MVGRPREFDRDEALAKAVDLFWRQGYEATGIADLTEHLGIARQSLYGAFGSKRELFLAAVERYVNDTLDRVVATLEGPGSALGNVRKVLDGWSERSADSATCGCLVTNSIAEFGLRDEEMTAILGRKLDRLERAFHIALERARAAGEIAPDKQPAQLARVFVTAGQGLAVVLKTRPEQDYARGLLRTLGQLLD